MKTRQIAVVATVLVLLAGIFWMSRAKDPQPPSPAPPPTESAEREAPPPTSAPQRAVTPADFELLPETHQAESIRGAMDGFQDWLDIEFPEAEPRFLGVDCVKPPCLIGFSYAPGGFDDIKEVARLNKDARGQIEDRVSFVMDGVHIDEGVDGRDYVWMYGVPGTLDFDEGLHPAMVQDAERRHGDKMEGIVPPMEPAIPGTGEEGYQGE